MEVIFSSQPNTNNLKPLFPDLKPRDQILVKVLKRTAPFRYLVRFRGHAFPVRSLPALKPGDLAFIELEKMHPFLKFKFIATLQNTLPRLSTSQIGTLLGLQSHPLTEWFIKWSVRLSLPVKREELGKLKKIYSFLEKTGGHSRSLLFPYFWFRHHFDEDAFHDPFFFMRWMFEEKYEAAQKHKIRKIIQQNANKLNPGQHEMLVKFVEALNVKFSNEHLKMMGEIKKPPVAPMTDRSSEIRDNFVDRISSLLEFADTNDVAFIQDILYFLEVQTQLFRSGRWICLPYFEKETGKNYFTFWRKPKNVEPCQYDFIIVWSSENFGEVMVSGKVLGSQLWLEIRCNSQDFSNLVDKYYFELNEKLQHLGLDTIEYKFKSGIDVESAIGKALFENAETNFEAVL